MPAASTPKLAPALILALDGATFDVIRPLIEAGRMPHLSRWMEEGRHAPLRSVTPPVTFPAWSSFMTGLEPGRHGVFDFTQKVPGAYRLRFVNASDRSGASLFAKVSHAGGRVLVLGMPATFPPEAVSGLLVCGFDAPVSVGTDSTSASDPDLYDRIAAKAGPWMRPDLDETAKGTDFHERAVTTLLSRIERKTEFSLEALRQLSEPGRPDLMMVVFSESDTVGHHYWRDHDPSSPRHDPTVSPDRRDAISAVYAKLDEACGRLREAYGEDALCLVISDHGMGGAARRVVHLNRHLQLSGLLKRRGAEARARDALARRARDLALRVLPPRLAQHIFRRMRGAAARLESSARFGGISWPRTEAFSEEANTFPGVWINLEGRESQGCVPLSAYESSRDRVIAALLDWRLPSGDPVVARALRREEVFEGPFVDRAPDVVVELALDAGYGLSLVPTPWSEPGSPPAIRELSESDLAGGRGRGMNGTHRSDGILVIHGGEAEQHTWQLSESPRLVDVAPSVLASMGVDAEQWSALDGSAWSGPRRTYTDEEDAVVERRLRALGYLE